MKRIILLISITLCSLIAGAQEFRLNELEYFNYEGVDAMAFDDFYPEGHQGGISFIMNGKRIAANGDIRFDETPGQWQQVEYVLGGGSSHYMFLVLAACDLLEK